MKRVLLDHCVPRRIRLACGDAEVSTVHQMQWATLQNGALLTAAEKAGFEVLVTADKNVRYQQNLLARRIAIVVLPTNSLRELIPLFSLIEEAVKRAQTGSYQEI